MYVRICMHVEIASMDIYVCTVDNAFLGLNVLRICELSTNETL